MITIVGYEDWTQVFDDQELIAEGHSVSAEGLLRALGTEFVELDMSTLPNDNYQVDNIAEQRDLSAVRAALEAHQ